MAKKPERFFTISHGLDNYEQIIDLSAVFFIRCSYEYDSRNDKWDYRAKLSFDFGIEATIHLSETGYKELVKNWKVVREKYT